MFEIEISNRQQSLNIDPSRLQQVVESVLVEERVLAAQVSVAVVDDQTIQEANRRFLGHDEATDVLTFVTDARPEMLEGDIIVNAQAAASVAHRYGWSPEDELILYLVHGTLHLVGYDDKSDEVRAMMRERERHYLAACDLEVRYEEVEYEADERIESE